MRATPAAKRPLRERTLTAASGAQSYGMTWKDLAHALTLHHGQSSGILSRLHAHGELERLTERRERCAVYVLPEYVNGRETAPVGRTQPGEESRSLRVRLKALRERVEAEAAHVALLQEALKSADKRTAKNAELRERVKTAEADARAAEQRADRLEQENANLRAALMDTDALRSRAQVMEAVLRDARAACNAQAHTLPGAALSRAYTRTRSILHPKRASGAAVGTKRGTYDA